MRLAAILLATGLLAGGCTATQEELEPDDESPTSVAETETAPEASAQCVGPDPALVDGIASGLTVTGGGDLANAQAIEVPPGKRNDQGWPELIVAATITGSGMDGIVGAWATAETGGPILALDSMAREFSDWGSAAQPGSQAAENRDAIARYDEVDLAIECVEQR